MNGQMMDAKEAASIVAFIAAAHPQWPATPETVAVYRQMLSDLPYPLVLEAVRSLIATDDRWPSIAAIRRRVASGAGTLAPSPGDAWGEVCEAIKANGRGSSPAFSHPAIASTVKTLGWWELCTDANPSATRAHFWKIYENSSKQADVESLSGTLIPIGSSKITKSIASNQDFSNNQFLGNEQQ